MPRKTKQLTLGSIPAVSGRLDGRTRHAKALKRATARRSEIAAGLLADLGRAVTMTDQVWAANVAGLVFQAEQLEALGLDASELRRQINQSMRTGGRRLALAPKKPRPSPAERFAALGAI